MARPSFYLASITDPADPRYEPNKLFGTLVSEVDLAGINLRDIVAGTARLTLPVPQAVWMAPCFENRGYETYLPVALPAHRLTHGSSVPAQMQGTCAKLAAEQDPVVLILPEYDAQQTMDAHLKERRPAPGGTLWYVDTTLRTARIVIIEPHIWNLPPLPPKP